MPFITAPSPRGGSVQKPTIFPFALSAITVDTNNNPDGYWGKNDIDCGCPCSILSTNNQYTSHKSFTAIDTITPSKGQTTKSKIAIKVALNSFLFKGILPPMSSQDMVSETRTQTAQDSIIKIYGLGFPIVIEDFLSDAEDETLKIWLTCCYSTRETTIQGTAFNAPCQGAITDAYEKDILKPIYNLNTPQIAFISAGHDFPEKLVITKVVNRSSIPDKPLIDRRAVEVHIPIGEVTKAGKVRAQYLRSNLWLADVCVSGIPIKMPISAFLEGPLY